LQSSYVRRKSQDEINKEINKKMKESNNQHRQLWPTLRQKTGVFSVLKNSMSWLDYLHSIFSFINRSVKLKNRFVRDIHDRKLNSIKKSGPNLDPKNIILASFNRESGVHTFKRSNLTLPYRLAKRNSSIVLFIWSL